MSEQPTAAVPAARLPRHLGRVLVLSGLGTFLWLLGSVPAAASADERPLTGGLVPQVAEQVAVPAAESVAPAVDTVLQAATPVLTEVVQTAAPAVAPVLQVATPVVEPLRRVADPVLTPAVRTAAPAVEPVPAPGSPAPAGPAAVPVESPVEPPSLAVPESPGAAPPVHSTEVGVPPLRVTSPPGRPDDVPPVSEPASPGGVPATLPAPATAPGSSADQPPADLATWAAAVPAPTLAATADGARDATGDAAHNPGFSPD
jgi:hypothetical protein